MRPVFVQYEPNCTNSFTGVKDLTLEKRFVISPNPTQGQVDMSYALDNNEPVKVLVTNMLGAQVDEFTMNGGFGKHSVDFSRFPSGTYLVRVTNNGQTFTSKIIVTH